MVAALVAVLVAGCSTAETRRFEDVCAEHGGFVVRTDPSFWQARIDCIKDNEVLYLPGFA